MTKTVSAPRGALLVVGMRWTDRLIGLVSMVILARLLVPEDFGIIAMASLVVGLIDVLLDMGVNVALIHNKDATQDDYDSAWTLRLIQSAIATAVVFAAAVPAAAYFRDPRVESVLQVLCLSLLLSASENIGVVKWQKKREFGVEFRFLFAKRMAGFVATMVAAWTLQTYWALVIGMLFGRFAGVVLSYAMHSMRPRLSFARMKPLISFSTWNLLRSIAGYFSDSLHRLIVGRRESTAIMGSYALGSEIAALPSTELLAPLSRVLFPMFVEIRDDPAKLKRGFLLALGIQSMVAMPAAVGLILVAEQLVRGVLGEKWIAAIPFIQIIAGNNILTSMGASGGFLLLALGRVKIIALNTLASVLIFATLATLVFPDADARGIATLRLSVATFMLVVFVYLVKREMPGMRLRELAASVWRPVAASAVMALVLTALTLPPHWPALAQLVVKVATGAIVYLCAVLALWRATGCLDGAESYLLEKSRLDGVVRRLLRAPSA